MESPGVTDGDLRPNGAAPMTARPDMAVRVYSKGDPDTAA